MAAASSPLTLDQIRHDLEMSVGKKVKLRANRGRRKVIEAEGILEKTYPNLFVVKLDKDSAVKRMSYTYADVLTSTVELTMLEEGQAADAARA